MKKEIWGKSGGMNVTLTLYKNPWVCDVRIAWMRFTERLTIVTATFFGKDLVCAQPLCFKGAKLGELTEHDLEYGCPTPPPTQAVFPGNVELFDEEAWWVLMAVCALIAGIVVISTLVSAMRNPVVPAASQDNAPRAETTVEMTTFPAISTQMPIVYTTMYTIE